MSVLRPPLLSSSMSASSGSRSQHGAYSPMFEKALKRWETPPTSPTLTRSPAVLRRRPSDASDRTGFTARTAPPVESSPSTPEPQKSPIQRFFSILRRPPRDYSASTSPNLDRDLPDLPPSNDYGFPYSSGPSFELGPPPAVRRPQPRSPRAEDGLSWKPYSEHAYANASSPTASRRTSMGEDDVSLKRFRFASRPATHYSGRTDYPRSVSSSAMLPAPSPPVPSLVDQPLLYRPTAQRTPSIASSPPVSSPYSKIRRRTDTLSLQDGRVGPSMSSYHPSLPHVPSAYEHPYRRSDFIDFGNDEEDLDLHRPSKDAFAPFARWTGARDSLTSNNAPAFNHSYSKRRSASISSAPPAAMRAGPKSFLALDEYDV